MFVVLKAAAGLLVTVACRLPAIILDLNSVREKRACCIEEEKNMHVI